jgi:hypothetical protein
MLTFLISIPHSFGIHSRRNKQEEEIKEMQIGKEIGKISLKTPPQTSSNVAGYKINLQKSVVFLYTINEQIEKEYRKTIPFTVASNKIECLAV